MSSAEKLSRVWLWVERIQSPSVYYGNDGDDELSLSLTTCGALQIMASAAVTGTDGVDKDSGRRKHIELGCYVYYSDDRNKIRNNYY